MACRAPNYDRLTTAGRACGRNSATGARRTVISGIPGGAARRCAGALALLLMAVPASADGIARPTTYGDAMRWYERAARAGDADAQFYLGYIHDRAAGSGNGIGKSLTWYGRAAARGDARAQFRLGLLHDLDPRLPRDAAKARHWYEAAARQGHNGARFNLARLVEGEDAVRAADLYARAALGGIGAAAVNLALLHTNGPDEVRDPVKAYVWVVRAVRAGVPEAEHIRDVLAAQLGPEALSEGKALAAQ